MKLLLKIGLIAMLLFIMESCIVCKHPAPPDAQPEGVEHTTPRSSSEQGI